MTLQKSSRIAILVLTVVMGCKIKPGASSLKLPSTENVVSMQAALHGAFIGDPDIGKFELPSDAFEGVLRAISSQPEAENFTAEFGAPIGEIWIKIVDGDDLKITFPWSGKNRLRFECNGGRYVRAGNVEYVDPITLRETAFTPDESINLYKHIKAFSPSKK